MPRGKSRLPPLRAQDVSTERVHTGFGSVAGVTEFVTRLLAVLAVGLQAAFVVAALLALASLAAEGPRRVWNGVWWLISGSELWPAWVVALVSESRRADRRPAMRGAGTGARSARQTARGGTTPDPGQALEGG